MGIEVDAVVYDCFSGFDPDAVGILGGAVKAGGLMLLMAPDIRRWPELDDPQWAKITAWGYSKPEFSHYIKRLTGIISESPDCLLVEQHKPLPKLPACRAMPDKSPDFSDQNQAVEAVKHVMAGHRRRPVVLLSDRGRGKSAALGIAAGQLLQGRARRIGLTGNSRQSVANVFKHGLAGELAADSLRFFPADKLIESKPDIDLLLVDEAASIPLSMLGRMLEIFPRIAFASTVHGYEGTGRGFMLGFKPLLDLHCRGWRTCILSTPIRWAENDPLESFLFDSLLLNAEPDGTATENPDSGRFEFGVIEKSDLVENESLLRNVFGLLTQAHYRTRPHDLRHLLDAGNVSLFGIRQHEQLMAVAVVAMEGGFDLATAKKIWTNRSRPNGHLLPGLLCAQQGLIDAARLTTVRIMRIVVRPEYQRHGIGKSLLTHIFNYYHSEVDLLGTTFGASLPVVKFWLDSGFRPVRIGHSQSHITATHACAMMKPVSDPGNKLAALAENRFSANFRHQLNSIFTGMDPALVPVIYRAMVHPADAELHDGDLMDLAGFAFANRNMENIPAALLRLAEIAIRSNSIRHDGQEMLLVERILLGKSWKNCSTLADPKGKKQGVSTLRRIVGLVIMTLYRKRIEPVMAEFGLEVDSQ